MQFPRSITSIFSNFVQNFLVNKIIRRDGASFGRGYWVISIKKPEVCVRLYFCIRYRNSICHPLTAIPVVPEHSTSLYMSNNFWSYL